MLEFTDKVVGTVLVSIQITEDDIANIIITSFEGGSNYWMGVDNRTEEWKGKPKGEPLSTWATKLLLEGKSIKFFDVHGEDNSDNWVLTLEKLLGGIELNAINRPNHADKENWDAADADCIVQYALFKVIVYG